MSENWNKSYSRINWKNYPSEDTPINETNLNLMDSSLNVVDNRVLTLDTIKLDLDTANTMVKDVTLNSSTGVITITFLNGTTRTYDTKLEKLAVNFTYDSQNQRLVITLDDGTKQYVDLSSLITEYEFTDTDTIDFSVSGGSVSAIVKDGSITGSKLQPNYLADIQAVGQQVSIDATQAHTDSITAKSYAVGGTGSRTGEDTDNAKYYAEQAEQTDIGQVNNEIADIVNVYGAKNLLPYPFYQSTKTSKGVTYTDNGDGSITCNGTATAGGNLSLYQYTSGMAGLKVGERYKLTGGVNATNRFCIQCRDSGGTLIGWADDSGSGAEITIPSGTTGIGLFVIGATESGQTVNNLTFRPMIRCASISDDTWQPYAPTNKEAVSWKGNARVGAKNLLTYPYVNKTTTVAGITYTDLGDGIIKANGNATNNAVFIFQRYSDIPFTGTYILSDAIVGTKSTYCTKIDFRTGGQSGTLLSTVYSLNGKESVFTIPSDADYMVVYFVVASGQAVNNLIIKPMIRVVEDTDETYTQYAMTNKELTDNKVNNTNIAPTENGATASQTLNAGSYIMRNNQLYKVTTTIASGSAITEGVNIESASVGNEITQINSNLSINYVVVTTDVYGNAVINEDATKYIVVVIACASDGNSADNIRINSNNKFIIGFRNYTGALVTNASIGVYYLKIAR